MAVEFSQAFIKELKKRLAKAQAKALIRKLAQTSPSDGDFVALVGHIIIREKRQGSFRFYFICAEDAKHVITADEFKDFLIKFVALSKKNNQQDVIDKLKEDLKKSKFLF